MPVQRQRQALEEEEQAPPPITNKCLSATTKRQSQSSNESANPEVEEISNNDNVKNGKQLTQIIQH